MHDHIIGISVAYIYCMPINGHNGFVYGYAVVRSSDGQSNLISDILPMREELVTN